MPEDTIEGLGQVSDRNGVNFFFLIVSVYGIGIFIYCGSSIGSVLKMF